VAGHDARVAELLDVVRTGGGPQLDFSRESLGPLWTWLLETYEAVPSSHDDMVAAGVPWWYPFHQPLAWRIGPSLAALVSPVAAYFAETIRRNRPGSAWALANAPRLDTHNKPVLRVAGGGELLPDVIVLVAITQHLSGTIRSPDRLLFLYATWTGVAVAEPPPGGDLGTYSVQRGIRHPVFDTEISFDDLVAFEEEDRLERFVAALGRQPGVERAAWQDREIVLVRAPTVDDATLEALVDRLWAAAERP
jgi:hypothetical protein